MTERNYTYCPRPRCLARQGWTEMRGSDARLARLFDGCGGGLINTLQCPECGDAVHPTSHPPSLRLRAHAWLAGARDRVQQLFRR